MMSRTPSFATVLEREAKAVAAQLRKVGIKVEISRCPDFLLWKVYIDLDDTTISWPVRLEHVRSVFLSEFGRRFYMHFIVTGESGGRPKNVPVRRRRAHRVP